MLKRAGVVDEHGVGESGGRTARRAEAQFRQRPVNFDGLQKRGDGARRAAAAHDRDGAVHDQEPGLVEIVGKGIQNQFAGAAVFHQLEVREAILTQRTRPEIRAARDDQALPVGAAEDRGVGRQRARGPGGVIDRQREHRAHGRAGVIPNKVFQQRAARALQRDHRVAQQIHIVPAGIHAEGQRGLAGLRVGPVHAVRQRPQQERDDRRGQDAPRAGAAWRYESGLHDRKGEIFLRCTGRRKGGNGAQASADFPAALPTF